MKNVFLTAAVLVLGTALMFTQDTTSGSSSGQSGASASSENGSTENTNQTGSTTTQQTKTTITQNSGGNSIQGCLTGSSGNYMLTNGMGGSYQLLGSDARLSANVNKQVEVMGT